MLPLDCGNEWGETVIEERAIRVGRLDGARDEESDDDEDAPSSWLTPSETQGETFAPPQSLVVRL